MEIDNLVLSGGGIKGYTYIGVIKALNEKKIKFKKLVGSSIGSFFALLIVLNYEYDELYNIFSKMEISFSDLLSVKIDNIDLDNIFSNLFCKYGMDSGDKILKIIKLFIKNKTQNADITLKELYEYNNIELTIATTNLTNRCIEYFNYKTKPDMLVHQAIRASISLPIFFNPVIIDNIYYIDGGITNNLPIDYFDDEEIEKTLGISLSCIKNNDNINSLTNYILGIFKCYIGFLELEKINKYKNNILILKQDCNPIETNICKTEIDCLIDNGYKKTINHLNNLEKDNINNGDSNE
jgi:NTE family protein